MMTDPPSDIEGVQMEDQLTEFEEAIEAQMWDDCCDALQDSISRITIPRQSEENLTRVLRAGVAIERALAILRGEA